MWRVQSSTRDTDGRAGQVLWWRALLLRTLLGAMGAVAGVAIIRWRDFGNYGIS